MDDDVEASAGATGDVPEGNAGTTDEDDEDGAAASGTAADGQTTPPGGDAVITCLLHPAARVWSGVLWPACACCGPYFSPYLQRSQFQRTCKEAFEAKLCATINEKLRG